MKRILKFKLFGRTIFGWLNYLIVQWFCIRITRTEDWSKFCILKWVVPGTGWGTDYKYIGSKK